MRHLLTTIIVVAIVFATITMMVGKCTAGNDDYDYSDTLGTAEYDDEKTDSAFYKEPTLYQELPLAEYGNIKVFEDYGLADKNFNYNDDVYSKFEPYLIRYVNGQPKDSLMLLGPNIRIFGDGSRCNIVVGVDTVNVNIKQSFGKTLDLRFRDVLPGCSFHRLSRHHALNDSAVKTDFQINIVIRDSTPLFIKDFISNMIRNDVARDFDELIDGEWTTPHVPMIRMRNRTVEQMMDHYYYQFRKIYDNKCKSESGSDERAYGERYSYQYYAYPVWQNSDSTLTTWKFYNYSFTGGVHAGEIEYYLTFDNTTGRILGYSDFFSKKNFQKVIENISHQIYLYHEGVDYEVFTLDASLEEKWVADSNLNIVFEGRIYPRPALTNKGIVFSYQLYQKGSLEDGIMHFTYPFKKDFHLK